MMRNEVVPERQYKRRVLRNDAGFTLLELAVVVVIISILFLFSYQKYLDLLVDVEKANVEQTVGVLRSAIGMKVAKMVVVGEIKQLKTYEGMNPLSLLAELPNNYEGEFTDRESVQLDEGSWYYLNEESLLLYKVKNTNDFFSDREGSDEIRYKVIAVFDDETKNIAGLSLRPLEKYTWFKKK